jgi:hypothetical protein
VCIC